MSGRTNEPPRAHDHESWCAAGPAMFTATRRAAARDEIEAIVGLVGLEPGARVLDMPCGPGRHALELARLGFAVTGVDLTTAFLAEAMDEAARAGLVVDFVEADMRDYGRADHYDAALNLYTSFGYFDDPADDLRVLRGFCRSLRRGAPLVLDTMSKEALARRTLAPSSYELDDGSIWREEPRLSDGGDWVELKCSVTKEGRTVTFEMGHRLYGESELRDALRAAGFTSVDIFGDLHGAAYDHDARRLVAVARHD